MLNSINFLISYVPAKKHNFLNLILELFHYLYHFSVFITKSLFFILIHSIHHSTIYLNPLPLL